jgi:tRNA 2-selenouridine synthase
VTSFVRALGLERAVALDGGYKAYRNWVRAELDAWRAPPMYVLRGLTGVGKTLVLRELERLRPNSTLDLEALAGHRGSVLGGVGLEPCTQKTFDTRILARISRGFSRASERGERCVVEGEGRKVGDALLPPRVWSALDAGTNLELTASIERRAEVLLGDYLVRESDREAIAAELPFLEQRLGPVKYAGVLSGLFASGRDRELVELLLERYYDPLYRSSEKGREYAACFDASEPARAAAEIADWIHARA